MAGLGFKDFAVGEVLTSADVDGYLMQQTVMRFADAAARGSALGTAVGTAVALAEGMVSYLDDADRVDFYDGAAWRRVRNEGIGANVVQATKTNTQSITSTSLIDVTGLSVTITPSSVTSKVLVIGRVNYALDAGERAGFSLLRDSTEIFLANAAGSRGRATHAAISTTADLLLDATMIYVDSPASTSATTYKIQAVVAANTLYINRGGTDSNSASYWRGTSSLLVVEVAA